MPRSERLSVRPIPSRIVMILAFLSLVLAGCGGGAQSPNSARATVGEVRVLDSRGREARVADIVSQSPWTVMVFISPACPVQKAHEARLRALSDDFKSRGVAFFGVSSEVDADRDRDRALAERLGMSVIEDRGAKLADAVRAEYSTHSVLFDESGRLVYSGGVDSQRAHMTDGAEPYLTNALDAALAGKPVTKAETEALGCPLRKR